MSAQAAVPCWCDVTRQLLSEMNGVRPNVTIVTMTRIMSQLNAVQACTLHFAHSAHYCTGKVQVCNPILNCLYLEQDWNNVDIVKQPIKTNDYHACQMIRPSICIWTFGITVNVCILCKSRSLNSWSLYSLLSVSQSPSLENILSACLSWWNVGNILMGKSRKIA